MKHIKPLTNPVMAQLEDRPTVLDLLGNKDIQRALLLIIGVPILYIYIAFKNFEIEI